MLNIFFNFFLCIGYKEFTNEDAKTRNKANCYWIVAMYASYI